MSKKLYAVITGDLIKSRQLRNSGISYIKYLHESLEFVGSGYQNPLFVYRGDSFQGVTANPERALKDVIILRLKLISDFEIDKKSPRIDARISIGLGEVDPLPNKKYNVGEMDGEAFEYSGTQLDTMKSKKQNLVIKTPWAETDDELNIYCKIIDRLISRWSKKKCEAVMYRLEGYTLHDIGKKLNIGGSAVHYRLEQTDYEIVGLIIQRYSEIIANKVETYESNEDIEGV